MRQALRAISLMLLCGAVVPATAASLRPMTTLTASVVRLSDLFDDAGPVGSRVIGPGPAPGGRIIVEAPQLAAIARQFGVDWRPASPSERTVLDRPGRTLAREQVLDALRSVLVSAGASADCDIELPGFVPPVVPAEASVQPMASQLDYDPITGRFTALLSVAGEGMAPVDTRVSGRAQETVDLPVAAERLMPGMALHGSDIRMARVHAGLLRVEVARLPEQAIGKALRHALVAGQPFALADLETPALIQKGATVLIQLDAPRLALTGTGQALDAGAAGQRIRVLNPSSRAVVEAEVTGSGRVRIEPDATPLVQAPRGKPPAASPVAP